MRGQLYAVVSGLFAALASLCGKYAMASSEAQDLCEATLMAFNYDEDATKKIDLLCDQVSITSLSNMLIFNYEFYNIYRTIAIVVQ